MKRVLFIAPDNVGIIKLIQKNLLERKDFHTDIIELTQFENKFVYKNLYARTRNFFSKHLFKINCKAAFFNNLVKEQIDKYPGRYDRIVIIRPDFLDDKLLKHLRSKTDNFIAYYWDSTILFPRKASIKNIFNSVYSFDHEDCKKYNFKLLTNFYYFEETPLHVAENVYCVMSYDKRSSVVEKIAQHLEENGIQHTFKMLSNKPFFSEYIISVPALIPYKEMLEEIAGSKVLLEISKDHQQGLTFRPFEALGMGKKLITSNQCIKNYDFYNENNIHVLSEENINIPPEFFTTPYIQPEKKIKEKYHLDAWIETLFVN
jgi:hypothetical protein